MVSDALSGQSISVRNLHKDYGTFKALDDVSLDIQSGELITLLGPSGSGKTTFLMTLAGFVRPSAGSILFGNEEVVTLPANKRNVGMVFQSFALFPHMTVGRNVGYALRVRGIPKKEIDRRVAEALELVRLSGMQTRRMGQLSGGQKQRVALARAIVFRPKILLMDEPLSALDKNLRETMQIEIRNLQRELGITTVSVTHDQREAMSMGDRIVVFNEGRLIQVDTPANLYNKPETSFVANFFGETNLEKVQVTNEGVYYQGTKLKLDRHPGCVNDAENYLVFRPERLKIFQASDQENYNVFHARIKDVVFQGDTILVNAILASGTAVAIRRPAVRSASLPALEPGSSILIGMHPDSVIIVPKN